MEMRVIYYDSDSEEHHTGTVLEIKGDNYVVMPDYNLDLIVKWKKECCDIL